MTLTETAMADEAEPDALNERQTELLAIVQHKGFATVEWLAERFEVSAQTIRRDIIRLDERGLLQRFHGGAGALEGSVRLGYAQKQAIAVDAKTAIGRRAAALVPEGATIFLDVGTTVEAVARALDTHRALRVFTNSLGSAHVLAGRPEIEVTVLGGLLRGADGSLVGSNVTAALRDLRFDLAFIGLSGWDDDGAPMDFDGEKIAVKRVAIARSATSVALGDATKFDRRAVMRIADAGSFGTLVADARPPETLARLLIEAGTEILIA